MTALARHQEDPGDERTRLARVPSTGREAGVEQDREGKAPPPGGSDGELEQAIAVLRSRVDEEFRITERLDSKTRQAFALSAGFYAVIQTVAFGSFAQSEVSSPERAALLAVAVAAGALLARVAYVATRAEELRDERDIKPSSIVDWANAAGQDNEYVRSHLVTGLRDTAEARAGSNEKRAARYESVVDAARIAMIAVGVELIVAIVARL